MKRILITTILFIILLFLTLITYKDTDKQNKITVAEVTHSIFYAPWYVALKNNYFDDLDIEVILTSGANNVIASVLSGDANIGLCGPEATIYVYKENNKDYIKSFAGLTSKDGQLLVLRNNIKYDNINDLEGLTILAGRSGGMPLMSFKEALINENIKNVTIDTSVEFANLTSAFISGNADGVNLFEPNATTLTNTNSYYIADSIGAYSGNVPYTAFNAKKSYIENNKEIIEKFYKGISYGLEYVNTHTSTEIAKTVSSYFPDTSIEDLTKMIDNYKKYDSWLSTPNITEELFVNLENIMIDNNELDEYVNYHDLIYEFN